MKSALSAVLIEVLKCSGRNQQKLAHEPQSARRTRQSSKDSASSLFSLEDRIFFSGVFFLIKDPRQAP
jgi:hypothetical protein